MAVITIADNGGSIKITIGANIRNITKSQIVEISIIKINIIKIDIGQGALHNIFIPFIDVTSPITPSASDLRDAISAFLPSASSGGSGAGSATEAKQIEEINLLTTINSSMTTMRGLVTTIDNKIFYEPLLVDDGGAGLIYKGYAAPSSGQEAPVWAIQRIQRVGDIDVYTWAGGNKEFVNTWIDRESLTYS